MRLIEIFRCAQWVRASCVAFLFLTGNSAFAQWNNLDTFVTFALPLGSNATDGYEFFESGQAACDARQHYQNWRASFESTHNFSESYDVECVEGSSTQTALSSTMSMPQPEYVFPGQCRFQNWTVSTTATFCHTTINDTLDLSTTYPWVTRFYPCPKGATLENGPDPDQKYCKLPGVPHHPVEKTPKCANPISTGTGCKTEAIELTEIGNGSTPLKIQAMYASIARQGGGKLLGDQSWFLDPVDRRIKMAYDGTLGSVMRILRASGGWYEFTKNPDGTWASTYPERAMVEKSTGYYLWNYSEQTVEQYNLEGLLVQLDHFDGSSYSFVHDTTSGSVTVNANPGRTLQIVATAGIASAINLPDGTSIGFDYLQLNTAPGLTLPGHLEEITFEDGSSKTFTYAEASTPYGLAQSVPVEDLLTLFVAPATAPEDGATTPRRNFALAGRSPHQLTKITNELGVDYAEFSYDAEGRATSSKHIGDKDEYNFNFVNSAITEVTNPLGGISKFTFGTANNQSRLTVVETKGGANLTGAYKQYAYDAVGNINKVIDTRAGSTTCLDYLAGTARPTVHIDGLPHPFNCATALVPGYTLDVNSNTARRSAMSWTATHQLLSQRADAKRLATYQYNGQSDLGAAPSCAPAGATIDGTPLPVLCTKTIEPTADLNGQQGLSVTANGTPRVWSYTYNEDGQLLSEDGPRTDVTDVTTYTYYAADDTASPPKYVAGDLASTTNAAGQITTVDAYDQRGRPTQITDSMGRISTYTYTPRGWLSAETQTAGGQPLTTAFTYLANGLMQTATTANGSVLTYQYDDAQRLTGVSDSLGNQVAFTLDDAGNPELVAHSDPGGAVARQVVRVFDVLGRLSSITGGVQ